jgi:hypothetical protein
MPMQWEHRGGFHSPEPFAVRILRVRRRLLNVLAGVSLFLGATTAAVWIRSLWRWDVVGYGICDAATHVCHTASVSWNDGRISLTFTRLVIEPGEVDASRVIGWHRVTGDYLGSDDDFWWSFDWSPKGAVGFDFIRHFSIRAWIVVLTFALLPALTLYEHLRRRMRFNENHCTFCGYDLRATPDRCPECGTTSNKPVAVEH